MGSPLLPVLERPKLTTAYNDWEMTVAAVGVYAPQEDSQLLIEVMDEAALARGARVADLCTGSGIAAIAAAGQGAAEVVAFDICPSAVHFARRQASVAGTKIDVHLGSWARAAEFGPYDLVVCNPPYVPHDPRIANLDLPTDVGPARAWDAGYDGRLVLDPLCASMRGLLAGGGTVLLVQSEFAEPRKTLAALASRGLDAEIVARQRIPFGPVMEARAHWLEDTGRLEPGRRVEELTVIRAERA